MRVQSILDKSLLAWFTSNTEAFWPVLLTIMKPYILRSSLMVDMEFEIPFTAPLIPISIHLLRLDVRSEGGRGGGRASLWSVDVSCYVEVFMFLFSNVITVFG